MPPGGPPLTDADRRRVAELHAAGKSRNEIARAIGRAQSTVTKIAAELGLTFDRSRTAEATRVKQVDAKARRATLATTALDDADEMRRRALAAAEARESRDYAAAYAYFVDRHIKLAEFDADTGVQDGKDMLTGLAEALGAAWRGQTDSS